MSTISIVQAQGYIESHVEYVPDSPHPSAAAEPPPVVLRTPPNMIYDKDLRIYIAVGIPFDIFFHNNIYFYHVNGVWYRSSYYKGPWTQTETQRIPRSLREHRIEELRGVREHAWKEYHGRESQYRGKHFQAEEPRDDQDRNTD
jgi:hypothetical protein